jgi:hypothetical protein
VRDAGITVCCGGILGMEELEEERIGLLHQLATLNPHPESVPINHWSGRGEHRWNPQPNSIQSSWFARLRPPGF